MENKEINIILNEIGFTNICKQGFIIFNGSNGRNELYLTKLDIKHILENGTFEKNIGQDSLKLYLEVNKDTIKEIIKRSPMYSNILD
jgi:hypothetical protein